jgi:ubiquinone/menaquinone biosynthesis C-methylase UbiE
MLIEAERGKETVETGLKYPGLQTQPDNGKDRGGLHQSIRRFLRAQFGRPTGFWGNIAGKIMAFTPSNKERIRWTISLLDAKPDDRVLEIGFGPGFAIELMSKIVSEGFVAGIDHSDVMVRQAGERNARAIREGRVALRLGSVSNLPKFDEPFDKIFTINSIHFWTEPIGCLKELRNMLKPGGLIAVTLQPRSRSATDTTTEEIGKEIAMNLERAGFSQVRLEIKQTKPVSVACALGIK